MLISPAKLQSYQALRSSAVWIRVSSYEGVHLDAGNHQNSGRAPGLAVSRRSSSTEDQLRPVGLVYGLCGEESEKQAFLFSYVLGLLLSVLFHRCVYNNNNNNNYYYYYYY
jgi:hypothetical protein